jgi:lauroyl/myristoyl acyltransferase
VSQTFGAELAPDSLRKVIRKTFKGIIDHYHEKLFLGYSHFPSLLDFLRKRIRLEGAEILEEALAAGKGVILVTGHFGAVEFLPGALAVRDYPITMICRFKTDRLRNTIKQRAEWVNMEIVDAGDGNTVLSAMKSLKRGRIIITEVDEFEEWRTGAEHHVTFLNRRLPADRTLETMHRRSGAPLVTALVRRDGRRRYTIQFAAINPVATQPAPHVGVECLKVLEKAVQLQPVQWYQWKEFGKIIKPLPGREDAHSESGYLAPELGVSVPLQA